MKTQELVTKMRLAVEESAKGNVNLLDEIHDPDIVIHLPPFPDLKGLKAEKQARLNAWLGFSGLKTDWEESCISGDTIIERYTVRVKHTGVSPQNPLPPTGKEVILKGCYFAHQKNGKIDEIFEYDDWLGFYQQLGIVSRKGSM
jgi:hypothetical protein